MAVFSVPMANTSEELNIIRAKHLERMDADNGWVTIRGTHTLIGPDGTAMGGGKLAGKKFSYAKSAPRKAKAPSGGGGASGGRPASTGTESSSGAPTGTETGTATASGSGSSGSGSGTKGGSKSSKKPLAKKSKAGTKPSARSEAGERPEDGDEISPEQKQKIIVDELGVSKDKAAKMQEALDDWNLEGGEIKWAEELNRRGKKYGPYSEYANDIEEYIDKAPKYKGTMYRGLTFGTRDEALAVVDKAIRNDPSAFNNDKTITSWSSKEDVANMYTNPDYHSGANVVFVCKKGSKNATSISHFTGGKEYSEVIASPDAKFKYVKAKRKGNTYYVYVKDAS